MYYFWWSALLLGVAAASKTEAAQVVDKQELKVSNLEAGSIIDYTPLTRHRGFFENDLRIYCYGGNRRTLARLFENVELQLDIEDDDYTQYEGATPEEVAEHYNQQQSLFSFSLFSQRRTRLQLSPFEQQCIGIEAVQPYRLRLVDVRVDLWRVLQLLLGILLFSYATKLSHNALFYYITGILLGICSSFMLLIWLSSKLMPRRTVMYGMLIGGWTVGLYVIQMLWDNIQVILVTYRSYVCWYILITGLVSFFFCYRLGPPKNKRSKNIVKWLLQLIALTLIYFFSRYEQAAITIAALTMLMHYFPRKLLFQTRRWYLKRFPPKRRLLTSAEYYEEGVRETKKALEELRAFASSPDCKQWKVMTKLNDPLRFAAFVEGDSHLRNEEVGYHQRFKSSNELFDDSDLSLDEDEHVSQPLQHVPYPLHRSQRSLRLNQPRAAFMSHEDLSEDEAELIEEADEDDVLEVLDNRPLHTSSSILNDSRLRNSNYNRQPTSPTSAQWQNQRFTGHLANNNRSLSSRASPLQQQRMTPTLRPRPTPPVAKRRSNTQQQSMQRTLDMRGEFGAAEDAY